MKVNRVWAMPSANTFEIPPIRDFVERHLGEAKIIVDPFARNSLWGTHTNDLNPNTSAMFHVDASAFLSLLCEQGLEADAILFDPPYSSRQCIEVYQHVGKPVTEQDTTIWGHWTNEKELIANLCIQGGIVLSFGWNSNGIGKKRGFEIEEVLMVAHGGAHNDTICVAERMIQPRLFHKPPLALPTMGNSRFKKAVATT